VVEVKTDISDAQWHQQELDERRRREDEILKSDPAYTSWSDDYTKEAQEHQDKCKG
jgi:hypothetical protein